MRQLFAQNVGGLDRLIRVVLALVLLTVGGWGLFTGESALTIVGLLAGGVVAVTAATQFCLVNRFLGIDSCSVKQ